MTNNTHPERKTLVSDQPTGDDRNLLNYIASTAEMILDRMATKDDIARLDPKIDGVEARLDAKIDGVEVRLDAKIDGVEARLGSRMDGLETRMDRLEVKVTAISGDLEQVHLRLDSIDRAVSSRLGHFEADMSRMRSVLYLLVKEEPNLLRMLGYMPPAGG